MFCKDAKVGKGRKQEKSERTGERGPHQHTPTHHHRSPRLIPKTLGWSDKDSTNSGPLSQDHEIEAEENREVGETGSHMARIPTDA